MASVLPWFSRTFIEVPPWRNGESEGSAKAPGSLAQVNGAGVVAGNISPWSVAIFDGEIIANTRDDLRAQLVAFNLV